MKNAIVLGASGGLGKEIAKELVSNGYHVFGTYMRNKPTLADTEKVTFLKLDIEDKKSIEKFIIEMKKLDNIDFFTSTIANTMSFDKFENIKISEFEKDMQVNYLSQVQIIQQLISKFSKDSNIIFILTEMIEKNHKYYSSYISSKYALYGLMKCLSIELAVKGIYVNSVSPAGMDTKFRWDMISDGKVTSLPSYMKEKMIKEKILVEPVRVAKKIMELVNSKTHGENITIR